MVIKNSNNIDNNKIIIKEYNKSNEYVTIVLILKYIFPVHEFFRFFKIILINILFNNIGIHFSIACKICFWYFFLKLKIRYLF